MCYFPIFVCIQFKVFEKNVPFIPPSSWLVKQPPTAALQVQRQAGPAWYHKLKDRRFLRKHSHKDHFLMSGHSMPISPGIAKCNYKLPTQVYHLLGDSRKHWYKHLAKPTGSRCRQSSSHQGQTWERKIKFNSVQGYWKLHVSLSVSPSRIPNIFIVFGRFINF